MSMNKVIQKSIQNTQVVNLLDNSNFLNPVNQRGETNYSVGKYTYTIDRWSTTSKDITNTINITDSGLYLKGYIYQVIEEGTTKNLLGKKLTFAVCLSDNNIYCTSGTVPTSFSSWKYFSQNTINNNSIFLGIALNTKGQVEVYLTDQSSSGHTFKWIALYEGEFTADTLPTYQLKNYDDELRTCQRYFIQIGNNTAWAYLTNMSFCEYEGYTEFFIPIPVAMRAAPKITISGSLRLMPVMKLIASIEYRYNTGNGIGIKVKSEGLAVGSYNLIQQNNKGVLTLSADL